MRLVDADESEKYLYEHLDDLHMIAAQNAIDEMPTIDAQPVKRGHWIIEKEEPMYGGHKKIWALRCSECGKDPIKHIGGGLSNWWFKTPPFCPVCGSFNGGEGNA